MSVKFNLISSDELYNIWGITRIEHHTVCNSVNGQKILHGVFRAKSTQVEQKLGTTGTKLIECTFRDGLVDGNFHYEVHTQEYVGE